VSFNRRVYDPITPFDPHLAAVEERERPFHFHMIFSNPYTIAHRYHEVEQLTIFEVSYLPVCKRRFLVFVSN